MNKIELAELNSFKDYVCAKYVLRISSAAFGPIEKTGFKLVYEVDNGYYLTVQTWLTMPKTISRM